VAFSDDTYVRLEYRDVDELGTLISGKASQTIRHHARALLDEWLKSGAAHGVAHARRLLDELFRATPLGALYRSADTLREERIHPPAEHAFPVALTVVVGGSAPVSIPLDPSLVPDLARWFGEWEQGATKPDAGPARELWAALHQLGCFAGPRRPPAPLDSPATFVGHATVLLTAGRTRLLVDPYLLPSDERFPVGYQPLTHRALRPDIILITHSHPDHFDPGTLLRFGPDVTILVPEVPRESLLSIDMERRLRQLGFRNVRTLGWQQETTFADFRIVALPFYGEQPTGDAVLHPEVRNCGNVYLVEAEGRRYGFTADAGRDGRGDTRQVARAALAQHGPLDVLFGGYRSFALYPIQYLMSSVPSYLLFVPRGQWSVRQQLMNGPDELLDTAEEWQTRCVVPYADGGAPWYWQLELGPCLDGTAAHSLDERQVLDPWPDVVLGAAAQRSVAGRRFMPSSVPVRLMRPGESLGFDQTHEARIIANQGHTWPYPAARRDDAHGEPAALTRKRVLLRMLAMNELARRGEAVPGERIQALSDALRRWNDLEEPRAMQAWLDATGLSRREYAEILEEWSAVDLLESRFSDEIERRVSAQSAFASMRARARSAS
jgi:L-ascorbate metabolism protein UlaG (beta-lactamase superfamily)